MRLLPIPALYVIAADLRASHDEVREAIERVKRVHWWLGPALVLVGFVPYCLFASALVPLLNRGSSLGTLYLLMLPLYPYLGLVLALLVRRKLLRRLVRPYINSSRCIQCRYSLIGLPIIDGYRTCPECGKESPVVSTPESPSAVSSK